MLAKGQTVKGRIWTYVRDDRPFGTGRPRPRSITPRRSTAGASPAASPKAPAGILQADAYSGYNELYDVSRAQGPDHASTLLGPARRQFFELADIAANARRDKNAAAISPIALEAVKRIDRLFDIDRGINGQSAEERLRVRKEQSAPPLTALEAWLPGQRARLLYAAPLGSFPHR